MRLIVTKFVPQLLTNDQKQQHINVCLEPWEKANVDSTFISRIILVTCDESWIYSYDPQSKQQSSQWKSPQSPREKEGVAGLEFNKEHAHCFFFSTWRGLFTVSLFLLTQLWLLLWHFEMFERKSVTKKTGTLAQPQLAP
jgi:hypothetical protein